MRYLKLICIILAIISAAIIVVAFGKRREVRNVPGWGPTEWASFEEGFSEWEEEGRP